MFKLLVASALLAIFSVCTSALLYPTEPISSTSWAAGEYVRVQWRDDGRTPRLKSMTPIDIKLYTSNDTFVRTLARNVSPTKLMQRVRVPRDIIFEDTQYFLRFTSNHRGSHQTIYSANFDILSRHDSPNAAALATDTLMTLSSPWMPSTTSSFPTFTDALAQAPAAQTTIHAPPLPGGNSHSSSSSDQDYTNNDRFTRGRLDAEKLKFRLVFVLWPALIGVSMSL